MVCNSFTTKYSPRVFDKVHQCNITYVQTQVHFQVMIHTESTSHFQPTLLARLMACVLLVLVSYGATAGAVHRHDDAPRDASFAVGDTINNPNDAPATRGSSGNGDCLICTLRQHLFVGVADTAPHRLLPPATILSFAAPHFAPYFSPYYAPRRGRAPPSASLL